MRGDYRVVAVLIVTVGTLGSLASGQISPASGINASSPCSPVAGSSPFDGITLFTQEDVDAISECTTINGSIGIDSAFSGDVYLPNLHTLSGTLGHLNGSDAEVSKASAASNLTGLIFPRLQVVGWVRMISRPRLQTVWFPQSVAAMSIALEDLPSLTNISSVKLLPSPRFAGYNMYSVALVNTSVAEFNLDGVSLDSIGDLNIVGNSKLAKLSLMFNNITALSMSNNTNLINLSLLGTRFYAAKGFYSLSAIGAFDITNCTRLAKVSCESLGTVSTYLTITKNDALENVTFTSLNAVSGAMLVSDCPNLSVLSLPVLTAVGGDLNITNTSKLTDLDFPNLQTVLGKVHIQGDFSTIKFPQLVHSFNGFTVNSSNPAFNCSKFDQLYSQNFIRGSYTCISAATNHSPATNNTNGSSTSPSSSSRTGASNSLSTGAKAGIGIGIAVVALMFIGITAYCFVNRKGNTDEKRATPTEDVGEATQLPQGGHHEKVEVEAVSKPGELCGDEKQGSVREDGTSRRGSGGQEGESGEQYELQ